ncbi:TatD family hydrolase [Denitrobacterium detoxificans]|jgi:TatD DNase family protein|uniref:TatD family hydrolase n=1 Tax=Denitrobacterium detoxificans TaxID=79604 RepID=UPI0026EBF534|nr:TatD family hydrolase [Denitrobacterium detoxificans]
MRYVDMHCHPSFLDAMDPLLERASRDRVGMFANTVLPSEYVAVRDVAEFFPGIRLGLGLHPWWVAQGKADEREVCLFEELAPQCRYIGEIGLDFGKRFAAERDGQGAVFRRVLAACARPGVPHVMSFHSSLAASVVMDEVERAGLSDAILIFHWFSGSSDELTRARNAGWYFSVGERMLATKRGRAYLQAIPEDRLLLETDLPSSPQSKMDYDGYYRSLAGVAQVVAAERGERVVQRALESSCKLLELDVMNDD